MSNFLFLFLFSFSSQAVGFQVLDKNGDVVFSDETEIQETTSVGQISVDLLNKNEIVFDGSELGIKEMFDLTNELDIISKSEMKAWGWCFSLNGEVPETLTHQTMVESNDAEITWFYAYAHYLEGEWISQCTTQY